MRLKTGLLQKCGGLLILIGAILLCGAFTFSASAETRVIRIGYNAIANYHMADRANNIIGYESEYMRKIALKNGWEYEYVKAYSWEEALQMLHDGEIDLLSPAIMTANRMTDFGYSTIPIGRFYSAIATLDTNDQIIFGDYAMLSGMKVGVAEGLAYTEQFEKYIKAHHIQPTITVYANYEELEDALYAGQVDAMITDAMRMQHDMMLVDRMELCSYYFMFRKDDTVLQNELNQALDQIEIESPNFQTDLAAKYFPTYNKEYFTRDELQFAKTIDKLTIACPSDMDPISYVDKKTGEVKGITRDLMELISEATGIHMEFIALPAGPVTYEYLVENNLDIIACVENNSINQNLKSVKISYPYMESQKVLIGRQGFMYSRGQPLKVAICTGSETLEKVLKLQYPNFTPYKYLTIDEGLEAVLRGEVDVMLKNQYVIESYLARPQYKQLTIIPSDGIPDILCLSLLNNPNRPQNAVLQDSRLMEILDKGIQNITEDERAKILIHHTTNRPYQFSLSDFVYQYQYAIFFIILVLCVTAGFASYTVALRQRNFALLRSNEKKLQNITNNINGGVVVLCPEDGMKIHYANDGFLELLQLPSKDYSQVLNTDYMMYIHPEDLPIVHHLVHKLAQEDRLGKQISLQMRIQRKDEEYIPIRFNGTVAYGENGMIELYCVIVDISQEVEMLQQLQMEQQKHNFIIEKSNDIIYEINLQTYEVRVSEMLQQNFGWSFVPHIFPDNLQAWMDSWKIHQEDMALAQNMFQITFEKKTDGSCVVRLMDKEGGYCWCRIMQYVMRDNADHVWIIVGKITNVDKEIREKMMLEEKTQLDIMTGLYNKDAFYYLAEQYLLQYKNQNCAIVFLDLDNFKSVNDQLGHIIGDEAIRDAGKKLQIIFSGFDLLARFGGDEFCLLVKDIPLHTLQRKLQWTLEKMRQTYSEGEISVEVSASIGVAYTAISGYQIDYLVDCADKALYEVKKSGKNNFSIYQSK